MRRAKSEDEDYQDAEVLSNEEGELTDDKDFMVISPPRRKAQNK